MKTRKIPAHKAADCRRIWMAVLLTLSLAGCRGTGENEQAQSDTSRSGEITIAVDPSLKPVIDSQIDVFEYTYPGTKINVRYVDEGKAYYLFRQDSVRLVIGTRGLREDEKQFFDKKSYRIRINTVAKDAVAVIANPENPLKEFTYDGFGQLIKSGSPAVSAIVFDGQGSSSFRLLKEMYGVSEIPAHWAALDSSPAVVSYVKSHPAALGMIGVGWISDKDDPRHLDFLNGINVIKIQRPDTAKDLTAYGPYQANMAFGWYPLTRVIHVISNENRTGLGTGFVTFMAGDIGQTIFLGAGLYPATTPMRLVAPQKKKNIYE